MSLVRVARTYLEQRTPHAVRPAPHDDPALGVVRATAGDAALFRRLYHDVGAPYQWRDRNAVSDDALREHLESSDVALWVLYDGPVPAGFFELQRHPDGSVEIAYFGLTAQFFGRGLGKRLLGRAAEEAWAFGAKRVWLHTCTLDSPTALPNYIARGFEPYKVETYEAIVPDDHSPTSA